MEELAAVNKLPLFVVDTGPLEEPAFRQQYSMAMRPAIPSSGDSKAEISV